MALYDMSTWLGIPSTHFWLEQPTRDLFVPDLEGRSEAFCFYTWQVGAGASVAHTDVASLLFALVWATAGPVTALPSLRSSSTFSISWAMCLFSSLMRGTSFSLTKQDTYSIKAGGNETDMASSPASRVQPVLMGSALSHFLIWLFALKTWSFSIRGRRQPYRCVTRSHNCIRPNLCNKFLIHIFLFLVLLLWLNPDWYKCLLCARHWYKPTANNSSNSHNDAMREMWTGPERIRNLPKMMQLLSG